MQTPALFFVLAQCALLRGVLLMPACDISEIGRADTSARVGLGTNGTARSGASDSGDLGGSAGSGSEQDRAYIPRPLQPNNCGTPDTFKACRVVASASIGPRKPEVLLEVLEGTGAEPAGLMNDPLPDLSRLTLGPVLLPSLHPSIDALCAEDQLQRGLKDTMQQRVEALQQQMTKLKQLSQRLQELLSAIFAARSARAFGWIAMAPSGEPRLSQRGAAFEVSRCFGSERVRRS